MEALQLARTQFMWNKPFYPEQFTDGNQTTPPPQKNTENEKKKELSIECIF